MLKSFLLRPADFSWAVLRGIFGNLGPRKVEVLNELKFPNHDGPKQFFKIAME